jgi:hypothetical protein
MNTPIMFTPSEILSGFLFLCGALITLSSVTNVILKFFEWKNKPNQIQDEKIRSLEKTLEDHEKRFTDYDRFFLHDKARLDDIDRSNKVTQRALLALLSHAINGNDVDNLQRAKDDLEDYLTNK